jgi:hypothetical protein
VSEFEQAADETVAAVRPGGSGPAVGGSGPAAGQAGSAVGGSGSAAGEVRSSADPEPATPVVAALRELDQLADRDLSEHPDVYQRIHGELQAALASIDHA